MLIDTIEILFRGMCVGLASSITVGPVAVLCIQRTLSKNRRSGLVSGMGVAVADTLMAIIAFFFYSMLQAQIEEYSMILQVIGGIFVVIVGVYIFFQIPVPQIRKTVQARKTPGRIFRRCLSLRWLISSLSFPICWHSSQCST